MRCDVACCDLVGAHLHLPEARVLVRRESDRVAETLLRSEPLFGAHTEQTLRSGIAIDRSGYSLDRCSVVFACELVATCEFDELRLLLCSGVDSVAE